MDGGRDETQFAASPIKEKTRMASPRSFIEKSVFYIVPALLLALTVLKAERVKGSWVLGPFLRPAAGNPVIAPNKNSVFNDPLRYAPVHWETLHTFNPAAVVRNGKIYVLYRAEDDTGKMMIGRHTSRVGLATSEDGIRFKRDTEPVFYPANDNEKDREWEGGCEDPRIVEAPDGTHPWRTNSRSTTATVASTTPRSNTSLPSRWTLDWLMAT